LIQALTPGVQIEGAVLVGAQIQGSALLIGGDAPDPEPPPVLDQNPPR
jgi:hypothetical protein